MCTQNRHWKIKDIDGHLMGKKNYNMYSSKFLKLYLFCVGLDLMKYNRQKESKLAPKL